MPEKARAYTINITRASHLEQLRRSAANGRLARLLDLGLEDDLLALLPHLRHKRLAGVNGAGEADLDVLDGAEPGGR